MSYRRDQRASRAALFDDIEGGGIAVSHDFEERDNDRAVDDLHDRVNFLKRLTGDIHEEVENHNKMLNRIGNEMDASRGIMSGTIDRFKMVFEKKSNKKICKLVAGIVVSFLIMFYLIRFSSITHTVRVNSNPV